MSTFAVILSGCGFLDGAEIHESVTTLLAIERSGSRWIAYAPDAAQADVVNHSKKQPSPGESRNILHESARIVRGRIEPTTALDAAKVDGVILPGGFGVAKNLCNFASAGADATARPEIVQFLRAMHSSRKPIGAICIAPALVAIAFRGTDVHPKLTIGNDAGTAAALESMGSKHAACEVSDCIVDETNRIVTTPAYMLATCVSEAAPGIEALVREVIRLARK
ncbi:MAG: isoprenoid biosynthesis glyoxalase ElbB [Planctomycetes bacterium]|nr:isoprenoid biosynthesis glyoxalase ElbB [Planctomycetota bacterium]